MRFHVLASVVVSAVVASSAWANDATTTQVKTVDFSGKPPFKRSVETLPVTDVAQLETLDASTVEMVTMRVVKMGGKPPYRRTTIEVPVIDVAQLEAAEQGSEKTKFKGRPPFKR